jgi:molybdate transport system ATP-binding protein
MIQIDVRKTVAGKDGPMEIDVGVDLATGGLVAVYGESGAGKTTLLRMIAGLVAPDLGKITADGVTWFDKTAKTNVPPQQRRVAMVFQDYALFPNMTVLQHLEYALPKGCPASVIAETMIAVELGQLAGQKPASLSGGQRQRLALARALVSQPRLLLLDEPLSALDGEMRQRLQAYIKHFHDTRQLTTVLVSHDKAEICGMADEVHVMARGKISRSGKPEAVLGHPHGLRPATTVAGYVLEVMQSPGGRQARVAFGGGEIVVDLASGADYAPGEPITLGITAAKGTTPPLP